MLLLPEEVRSGDLIFAVVSNLSGVVEIKTTGGVVVGETTDPPQVVETSDDERADDIIFAARSRHRLLIRLGDESRLLRIPLFVHSSGTVTVDGQTSTLRALGAFRKRQRRPTRCKENTLVLGEVVNITVGRRQRVPLPAGLRPFRRTSRCVTFKKLVLALAACANPQGLPHVVSVRAVFVGTFTGGDRLYATSSSPYHCNALTIFGEP